MDLSIEIIDMPIFTEKYSLSWISLNPASHALVQWRSLPITIQAFLLAFTWYIAGLNVPIHTRIAPTKQLSVRWRCFLPKSISSAVFGLDASARLNLSIAPMTSAHNAMDNSSNPTLWVPIRLELIQQDNDSTILRFQ